MSATAVFPTFTARVNVVTVQRRRASTRAEQ
jgi:hypothetical protein